MKRWSFHFFQIAIIFFVVGVTTGFSAEVENVYINKALKAFVSKDFKGAVRYLDQVLQINPNNSRAPRMLTKCHLKLADQYYRSKNFSQALEEVQAALDYSPGNTTAETLAKKIKRKLSAPSPRPAMNTGGGQVTGGGGGQIIVQTGEGVAEMGKKFAEAVKKTTADNSKLMSQVMRERAKQDSIAAYERKVANERILAETQKKDSFLSNTMLVASVTIGGIVFFVVILFVVVLKMFLKSSQLTQMQQTEAIKGLLSAPQMQLAALPPGMGGGSVAPMAITSNAGKVEEVNLDAEDDMERANAVESVMAELVTDDPADEQIRSKLEKVRGLLNDPNNRVRSNAAKAIYEVDPQAAIETLKGMLESGSKRMMASSIWTLGEIADEDALHLLLEYSHTDDEIIRYNVSTALGKVKEKEKFEITKADQEKLEQVMQSFEES